MCLGLLFRLTIPFWYMEMVSLSPSLNPRICEPICQGALFGMRSRFCCSLHCSCRWRILYKRRISNELVFALVFLTFFGVFGVFGAHIWCFWKLLGVIGYLRHLISSVLKLSCFDDFWDLTFEGLFRGHISRGLSAHVPVLWGLWYWVLLFYDEPVAVDTLL